MQADISEEQVIPSGHTFPQKSNKTGAKGNVKLLKHYLRPTAYFPLCDGPLFVFMADRVFSFLLGPQGQPLNSRRHADAEALALSYDVNCSSEIPHALKSH